MEAAGDVVVAGGIRGRSCCSGRSASRCWCARSARECAGCWRRSMIRRRSRGCWGRWGCRRQFPSRRVAVRRRLANEGVRGRQSGGLGSGWSGTAAWISYPLTPGSPTRRIQGRGLAAGRPQRLSEFAAFRSLLGMNPLRSCVLPDSWPRRSDHRRTRHQRPDRRRLWSAARVGNGVVLQYLLPERQRQPLLSGVRTRRQSRAAGASADGATAAGRRACEQLRRLNR